MAHRLASADHRIPAAVVAVAGAAILAVPTGRLYQGLFLFVRTNDSAGVDALVHHALAWMPWPFRDPAAFPDTIVPGLRMLLIGLAITALAAATAHRPRACTLELPISP